MRYRKRQVLGFFLLVFPLLVSSCGRPKGDPGFAEVELDEGRLELRSSPPFGFGSHEVYFYFHGPEASRLVGRTILRNDGANLGPHNVAVTRLSQTSWEIVLKGQEQADETWKLEIAPDHMKLAKAVP